MKDELKPCPFCGAESPTVWKRDDDCDDGWSVKCVSGCGVSIDGYVSRKAAVKAWNSRVGSGGGRGVEGMFVALYEDRYHQPVTAGSDAPEFAKCIYCGGRLKLVGPTIGPSTYPDHLRWANADRAAYSFRHLTNEAAIECRKARENTDSDVCDGEKGEE